MHNIEYEKAAPTPIKEFSVCLLTFIISSFALSIVLHIVIGGHSSLDGAFSKTSTWVLLLIATQLAKGFTSYIFKVRNKKISIQEFGSITVFSNALSLFFMLLAMLLSLNSLFSR